MAGKAPPLLHSSGSVLPEGTANKAPNKGNTSHAKIPCTSQKLSHDHFFTLLMGTYELLCPKLPMAIINKPISVFIKSMIILSDFCLYFPNIIYRHSPLSEICNENLVTF